MVRERERLQDGLWGAGEAQGGEHSPGLTPRPATEREGLQPPCGGSGDAGFPSLCSPGLQPGGSVHRDGRPRHRWVHAQGSPEHGGQNQDLKLSLSDPRVPRAPTPLSCRSGYGAVENNPELGFEGREKLSVARPAALSPDGALCRPRPLPVRAAPRPPRLCRCPTQQLPQAVLTSTPLDPLASPQIQQAQEQL